MAPPFHRKNSRVWRGDFGGKQKRRSMSELYEKATFLTETSDFSPDEQEPFITSVPQAPTRRMNASDKTLMNTNKWSNLSDDLKLEDPVSLADATSVVLQGVVAYVGKVHFDSGIWVGVQLTGPSVGKGYNSGAINGRRYFSNVGKRNGVFVPISKVQRRIPTNSGDKARDRSQRMRQTTKAQMAEVKYVESLKQERSIALLKADEQKPRRWSRFDDEEVYIQRLKEQRLNELRVSRAEPTRAPGRRPVPKLKFGNARSRLCKADLCFVQGLQEAHQNFVLTDPTLPDNPVTFASQAFLNMTGYKACEILGKNCRFLQGEETDEDAVDKIRMSILEGSDCSLCLLNYKKNGTPFWNQFFITALRSTKGRVKNYVGVQCEVSQEFARKQNRKQKRHTRSEYVPEASVVDESSIDDFSSGIGSDISLKRQLGLSQPSDPDDQLPGPEPDNIPELAPHLPPESDLYHLPEVETESDTRRPHQLERNTPPPSTIPMRGAEPKVDEGVSPGGGNPVVSGLQQQLAQMQQQMQQLQETQQLMNGLSGMLAQYAQYPPGHADPMQRGVSQHDHRSRPSPYEGRPSPILHNANDTPHVHFPNSMNPFQTQSKNEALESMRQKQAALNRSAPNFGDFNAGNRFPSPQMRQRSMTNMDGTAPPPPHLPPRPPPKQPQLQPQPQGAPHPPAFRNSHRADRSLDSLSRSSSFSDLVDEVAAKKPAAPDAPVLAPRAYNLSPGVNMTQLEVLPPSHEQRRFEDYGYDDSSRRVAEKKKKTKKKKKMSVDGNTVKHKNKEKKKKKKKKNKGNKRDEIEVSENHDAVGIRREMASDAMEKYARDEEIDYYIERKKREMGIELARETSVAAQEMKTEQDRVTKVGSVLNKVYHWERQREEQAVRTGTPVRHAPTPPSNLARINNSQQ